MAYRVFILPFTISRKKEESEDTSSWIAIKCIIARGSLMG